MQELENMTNAEKAGLTTRKPKKRLKEMLNVIGDSLSNLASSDDEEDGEDEVDEKENTQLGKLSKDDEPSWVMGTISRTVQQCMEGFLQKQMRSDKLMQPG